MKSLPALLLICATAAYATECEPSVIPQPFYPPLARQARISGVVKARITVDRGGKFILADQSGPPILRQGVEASLQSAKVLPACSGSSFKMTYTFQLDETLPLRGWAIEFRPPDQFLLRVGPEPVNP